MFIKWWTLFDEKHCLSTDKHSLSKNYVYRRNCVYRVINRIYRKTLHQVINRVYRIIEHLALANNCVYQKTMFIKKPCWSSDKLCLSKNSVYQPDKHCFSINRVKQSINRVYQLINSVYRKTRFITSKNSVYRLINIVFW